MKSSSEVTVAVADETFAVQLFGDVDGPKSAVRSPVVVLLHGAAMSSDSWARCAELMVRGLADAPNPHGMLVCAPDFRGHGKTAAAQSKGTSLEQLVTDVKGLVDALFADVLGIEASRPFYLIGHSLGGAVAAACVADKEFSRRVAGVSMVDIVEETAVFGLRHMPGFLEKRPPAFESVVAAAKWYVAEGGMKTIDGAMRSVGRTLVAKDESSLTWRTDLAATAGDWEGWFTGMNANFLSTSAPKLLLLANTDRLDKGLTLAMMQGKFQLEVVREAGHHVQEDQPAAVAAKLARFVVRIDTLTRKLPPAPTVVPKAASPAKA
jgi:protein phosphatase methylesterase 1